MQELVAPPRSRAPRRVVASEPTSWPGGRHLERLRRWSGTPAGIGVLLALLVGVAVALGIDGQRGWLWVDEGLTAGISGHPLHQIPGLLRQDGSPPLYYLLLHVWITAFGSGEVALHAFSLVFAAACVPAALWAGWSLFGRKVGWTAALLTAGNPFLTYFGREARMYTMVALLALLATACFLHAFAFGRRRYLPALGVLVVLLLYTHNWSLYFLAGAALALIPCLWLRGDERGAVVRDAALVFGLAAAAYLPWVPTLLYQLKHTGAPWSQVPKLRQAISELDAVLGDERVLVILLLVGGAGLARLLRRRGPDVAAIVSLVLLAVVPLVVSWLSSQVEPNWATRYFAMIVGSFLLLMALGLARVGVQGLIALGFIMLFWTHPLGRITGDRGPIPLAQKSNVKGVAASAAPLLHSDDLVVSTHPEQTPVLHYYLPKFLHFATPMGPVRDPAVFDWRDVVSRMEAATATRDLVPLVDRLPARHRILLVGPVGKLSGDRDPDWFVLFHRRDREWRDALQRDPRLHLVATLGPSRTATNVAGTSVYALLFQKT